MTAQYADETSSVDIALDTEAFADLMRDNWHDFSNDPFVDFESLCDTSRAMPNLKLTWKGIKEKLMGHGQKDKFGASEKAYNEKNVSNHSEKTEDYKAWLIARDRQMARDLKEIGF